MDGSTGANPSELDDTAISVYRCVVQLGGFDVAEVADRLVLGPDQVAAVGDLLWQLKLLTPGGDGRPPIPVDPRIVEAELTGSLERDIRQRQHRVAQLQRQLHVLASFYADGHRDGPREETVKALLEPSDVRRELAVATRQCKTEVLTLQPGGGRDAQTLRDALDRDLSMIERGIRMRITYHHTARANLATRMYVRDVTAAGAEVRTADEVFERIIIFDRKVAFVPAERIHDDLAPGAAIVTEPTVVGFLCRSYEHTWESAQPFDARDVQYEQTTDELRAAIIRLMACGLKDDVIARRLGMATRTCRRHIAVIMEGMEANSRFQAGVRACLLGLLPMETVPDASGEISPGGTA